MEVVTPQDLGSEIREWRVRQGKTQGELAVSAGVSRQWLVRLESGHDGAELGRVLSVTRALGAGLMLAEREDG